MATPSNFPADFLDQDAKALRTTATLSAGDIDLGNVDVEFAGTAADTNSGNKSAATMRVVIATDQPQLSNKLLVTPDANSAVNVSQINGVTPLMGAGNTGTGSHRVTIATDQAQLTNPLLTTPRPETSGGLSIFRSLDLDESAETIKASAGQIYSYHILNTNAAARYVKIYNNAGTPTEADTPVITLYVPPTSAINFQTDVGIAFGTGISARATTGVADNDTGAPGANEVLVNVFYK